MALDAAHRSSIYEKFRPLLGDDDANALMSEFPSVEAHELVTKDFLRAELAAGLSGLEDSHGMVTKDSLRAELAALEAKLTLRLGGAIAGSTALLLSAMGLLR